MNRVSFLIRLTIGVSRWREFYKKGTVEPYESLRERRVGSARSAASRLDARVSPRL